jgi:uncharacterized membrane-anchored protein
MIEFNARRAVRLALAWCVPALLFPGLAPVLAQAEQPPGAQPAMPEVSWTLGPSTVTLGSIAEVTVPDGYRFADGDASRKLLEAMGNPTSGSELGFLAPSTLDWFVIFEFSDTGYVKDDEKDKLDADAILVSIKKGTEAANEERKKRGWSTLDIVGWEVPPRYDPESHNLQWAIRGRSAEGDVVNFNTRILGRKGVMEASLVVGPEALQATLPAFHQLLGGYGFKSGERYAEYKSGDRIAEYGLTALVAGGAAAVALKTGLLQKFWKLIVIGVVALGGALKRVFASLTSRRDQGVLKR